MQYLLYSAAVFLTLLFVIKLFLALKGGRMLTRILLHALLGFVFLAIVNITSRFSGVYIPINPISVTFTAMFGAPSVCGLLIIALLM